MAIDITERLLLDAAGRETLELARALLESGQVVSAAYLPPVLKGLVREGHLELRAGLKISSQSDIENMCSCRASREWGSICAHSVAVGLALLKKRAVWTGPAAPGAGPAKALPGTPSPSSASFHSATPSPGRGSASQGGNPGASDSQTISSPGPEPLEGGTTATPRSARVPGVTVGPPASPVPEPGTFSLTVEGSLTLLTARLQRVYSKRVVTLGITSPSENWALPDPNDPSRVWCRDLQSERAALEELKRFGFAGPDTTGQFVLRSEAAILEFFGEGCPKLERQKWELSFGPRFRTATAAIERIAPRVEIASSGEQWFELGFDLAASTGERFSPAELQRLVEQGKNHVRLRNGKVAVFNKARLNEFKAVLGECGSQQLPTGAYRIHHAHAGFLENAVGEAGFGLKAPESWRAWARSQQQQGGVELAPMDLGDLGPVLRAYQKQGASWLGFLAAHGLGGILADDMGLGKTLQALAFLRSQPGPSLVVCPSSLVFNWRREAEKFTPERKILLIEGSNRAALFSRIPEADLVITSYPLLRRDAERYRRIEFSTVVLDEAQHIKNPSTKNAQAAGILRASNRFILTGTPVENSLRDLWSLMDFVMPGYLGDRDSFRDRYEIPISRQNSLDVGVASTSSSTPASTRVANAGAAPAARPRAKEALDRLSKRLRPFLLRRRKQEVASDLPAKLEQVAYCELSEAQRQVYASLLRAARNQVTQALADKNQARMLMLTALLRLRQAACDLRLLNAVGGLCEASEGSARSPSESQLGGLQEATYRMNPGKPPSGKLEMFQELLQEALDGGHRVLVFSQFVSMLALIRKDLEKAGIDYCYLDGQTRERAAEVDRFQGSTIPVFLVSLKAGGVGLNLTAADTVIHFDPWWNPAVEAQATDRAHRIGQKKVVTSYKLIARGTVEEKILNLQRKKRELIEATIENEEPLMEGLSMEEIQSLLLEPE